MTKWLNCSYLTGIIPCQAVLPPVSGTAQVIVKSLFLTGDEGGMNRIPPPSGVSSRFPFCSETSAPPGGSEDYVADSEDEGTKNFKGRVRITRTLWNLLWNLSSNQLFSFVSLSCSWSATTRPSTALTSPLWGSSGSPGWRGGIGPLLAIRGDDDRDFPRFAIREGKKNPTQTET